MRQEIRPANMAIHPDRIEQGRRRLTIANEFNAKRVAIGNFRSNCSGRGGGCPELVSQCMD
jgi:hypothetical protein